MPERSEECFVYIQMPQSQEVLTCGRYARERTAQGDFIGRFVYGRRYRENPRAVPIDPINLPLSDQTFETTKLEGVFGALRDSAPDAWGRRVIEHELGRLDVSEVEYLLNSPEDRAGALSFGLAQEPPAPTRRFNNTLELAQLLKAAQELEALPLGEEPSPELQRLKDLVQTGTSMGGARPKNVVKDDDGIWLAKFPARGDRWNNAAVEAAMLALAERCGIRVPERHIAKVGTASVLLVRRFDREPSSGNSATSNRARMVSALTVLDAEEVQGRERWSYLLLSDELQRWSSRPKIDRHELFKRMVLNALVTNNDDHPRNHALIAMTRDWRLSPAYDITPNPVHSHERDLAMTCGIAAGRRATKDNLVSSCLRFGLQREDAMATIDEMRSIVAAHWEHEVLSHGGSRADCNAVRPAFEIPGFDTNTLDTPS